MLIGIQSGFGFPHSEYDRTLGEEPGSTLTTLYQFGFDGCRLDCQDITPELRSELIREVEAAGLYPFVIVRDASQMDGIHGGVNIEIRSEPDIHGISPDDYRLQIEAAYSEARQRGLILWAGTVSNLNERGIEYLRALRPQDWPADLPVSVHWYPHGRSPLDPHPGFATREAEVAALKDIIGDRPWGVSEMGYHTGRNLCLGFWPWRWSDADVARHAEFEWKFWAHHGARFAVWYQLADGPEDTKEHLYGIRRTDGTWKPVASTPAVFKQAHASARAAYGKFAAGYYGKGRQS